MFVVPQDAGWSCSAWERHRARRPHARSYATEAGDFASVGRGSCEPARCRSAKDVTDTVPLDAPVPNYMQAFENSVKLTAPAT